MAHDVELERLAKAQEQAFQRSHQAYELAQRAWERRSAAGDSMHHAFVAQQHAYEEQETTWQQYRRVQDSYGPRIDSLKAQQETAYHNMVRSFESASSAHERRDGASAKTYATEGHRYKAESQQHVAERRRLVQELKDAWSPHEDAKAVFQAAKEMSQSAKQSYTQAKATHERAQAEFKLRKEEANQAKDAFHKRLEHLKAQNKERRENDRAVAQRVGVPYGHLDNIKVRRNRDGSYDIFYGGAEKPDGFGHGHATLDPFGRATHDRRPFDANSPENFADEESFIDFQRSKGHRGGYGLAHYGYVDGKPVTFAFGWGSRDGHTLLADGHVDKKTFHRSENHNHYGPGSGPNHNVMDRGRYTGLDA